VMNFSKMKTCIGFCILCILVLSCGRFSGENFRKLSPFRTGIDFLNELFENDTLNYTKFPYMYMGGGVSVGDINNDGLDDIFFTGNLVANKLYLNKGNMRFEDISEKAGITGNRQWFTGSTMADVNNDGWLDIYVCVTTMTIPSQKVQKPMGSMIKAHQYRLPFSIIIMTDCLICMWLIIRLCW